jgi:UDP-N-acetylmuramyl pentapeptide phosphotransferase/UDP-N-acetylglucosamine-1-phosphate transferase
VLFVAALPVFLVGLLEDITKTIGAKKRLFAAFVSAGIAWWLLGGIRHVSISPIDWALSYWPISLLFTIFAVGGFTHALNIVDGMNGLVAMIATLMAMSIGLVALQVGDMPIVIISAALASAVLGFMIWNFPFGRVFLGDGGAYFLGFMLAELAVLLVARNPSVSPFYALAVLFYPVFETVFSMWRRRFKRGVPMDQPDALHLHQLVFRRLVRITFSPKVRHALPALCNALASSYMWLLALIGLVPATIWWDNAWILNASLLVFAASYTWLYNRLVSWRRPEWLLLPAALRDHR